MISKVGIPNNPIKQNFSTNKNQAMTFGQKMYLSAYLAGPDVFLPNAMEIAKIKQTMLQKIGIKGNFPLDNVLDLKNLTKQQAGLLISKSNEALMRQSDMGLFNLTPFRSPSADVGTVYEEGFMAALGKILYGYSNTAKSFNQRTRDFLGNNSSKTVSGSWIDANKMHIEDFNLEDNLMIPSGIANSGGKFVTVDVPEAEIHTSLAAFSKLIETLSNDFSDLIARIKGK